MGNTLYSHSRIHCGGRHGELVMVSRTCVVDTFSSAQPYGGPGWVSEQRIDLSMHSPLLLQGLLQKIQTFTEPSLQIQNCFYLPFTEPEETKGKHWVGGGPTKNLSPASGKHPLTLLPTGNTELLLFKPRTETNKKPWCLGSLTPSLKPCDVSNAPMPPPPTTGISFAHSWSAKWKSSVFSLHPSHMGKVLTWASRPAATRLKVAWARLSTFSSHCNIQGWLCFTLWHQLTLAHCQIALAIQAHSTWWVLPRWRRGAIVPVSSSSFQFRKTVESPWWMLWWFCQTDPLCRTLLQVDWQRIRSTPPTNHRLIEPPPITSLANANSSLICSRKMGISAPKNHQTKCHKNQEIAGSLYFKRFMNPTVAGSRKASFWAFEA